MAFNDSLGWVAQQALKELFDHHIETALRSVLPFTRREPGPLQLDVAGTRVPIDRISAAVRREIAPLIDGEKMARDIELMMRSMKPVVQIDPETGRWMCCGTDALSSNPFHAAGCPNGTKREPK